MLFYGDIDRFEEPSSIRSAIAAKIEWAIAAAPGRERHEVLVRALIEAGELVQGLADQRFEAAGVDDRSDIQEAGAGFLLMLAQALRESWTAGFSGWLDMPSDWLFMLERLDGPEPIRMKRGEGYAFYCLYPEIYIEAATRSRLPPETVVIGLRSIGTSLAALVASALGSHSMFTLRPTGHPFDRRVAIAPRLARQILEDPTRNFAIVDEGPGMSGSSFGCVAEWLIGQGVDQGNIHVFPSHGGRLGPRANPAHSALWDKQPRHFVSFDDTAGQHLQTWASDLVGGRSEAWEDISGGGWRAHRYSSQAEWPPVHASMERRKFLMRAKGSAWLVKFAGLDALANRRLKARAALAEAGFTPPYAGAAYGFHVEEWIPARGKIGGAKIDLVDHVARYLGFRARQLPVPHGGASVSDLRHMAVFNTEQALGPDAAGTLRRKLDGVGTLRSLRRIDSDNRLHHWEWLPKHGGGMLKTDAIDHCAAHDFIGCQDIAWDIAGATVEFELAEGERARLAEAVMAAADVDHPPGTLSFFEFCYLSFQIGLWTHARMGAGDDEAARIDGALMRYMDRLRLLLRE